MNELDVRKPLVVSIHKEVNSWDSTTWFRIWPFQTPVKAVSSNTSLDWTVRFLAVMIGVSWKRESRTYQMAPTSPLIDSPLFVFTSIVYGLTWMLNHSRNPTLLPPSFVWSISPSILANQQFSLVRPRCDRSLNERRRFQCYPQRCPSTALFSCWWLGNRSE
jgi:hypothetical protein